MTTTHSSSSTTTAPSQQKGGMLSHSTPQLAPRRCFFKDVSTISLLESTQPRLRRIRVMGLLSQIVVSSNENQQHQEVWILDDGTGTLELQADARMRRIPTKQQSSTILQIKPGMSLECLAYWNGSINNVVWTLEWCAVISHLNAQSLRWLELSSCHQSSASSPSLNFHLQQEGTAKETLHDSVWGYPCVDNEDDSRLANEVVRLLSLQQEEDSLSVSDLSLLLETSEDAMVELLQELQLSGRVYQTETGQYVPLT